MARLAAATTLLLGLVSCQPYPQYKQRPTLTPGRFTRGLGLLTGGVSEFIVDGRTYGRDLPPLLTGAAIWREFEEDRARRQRDSNNHVFGHGFDGYHVIGHSFDGYGEAVIPLNDIIHGDDLVSFGRPREETFFTGRNNVLFESGRRKISSRLYLPRQDVSVQFDSDISKGNSIFRGYGISKPSISGKRYVRSKVCEMVL